MWNLFDEVESGITEATHYAEHVADVFATELVKTPLAFFGPAFAELFAALQADVAKVEIVLANGEHEALVMTQVVYSKIIAFVKETKKLMANQTVREIVDYLLQTGIPMALDVIARGAVPTVRLGDMALMRLLPLL